jgi:hypothetical protein
MKRSAIAAVGLVTIFVATGCVEKMPGPDRPRPERPKVCTQEYAPVCAVKGRQKKTFSNACMARAERYVVVSAEACKISTQ